MDVWGDMERKYQKRAHTRSSRSNKYIRQSDRTTKRKEEDRAPITRWVDAVDRDLKVVELERKMAYDKTTLVKIGPISMTVAATTL